MPLPGINIEFDNGQIGAVLPLEDGVVGFMASAKAVADTFALNTAYIVRGMADVSKLGIVPDTDNYRLFKACREFFAEAGEGSELWIMGRAKTEKVSEWFTQVDGIAPVEDLLNASNGRIKTICTVYHPTAEPATIENGLDADVWVTINAAQTLLENYTNAKYAPVVAMIEGYAFNGNVVDLKDLFTMSNNRVGVMIGDTEKATGATSPKGAAMGLLAGRIASNPVHRNIGRVKDGPLSNLKAYIGDAPAELFDTISLDGKAYITLRTHANKSGYYFSDDHLACPVDDDYHYLTRRRVIDKAYRVASDVMSDYVLDDVPVLENAKISPFYAKSVEGHIESALVAQMSSRGEISADVVAGDTGVKAWIDPNQNIVSTSRLEGVVRVRPHGYNRFVDILLGYQVNSTTTLNS